MAKVETAYDAAGGKLIGKFTITADEALDIRKTALTNAIAFVANTARTYSSSDVIEIAEAFEAHLTRNTGNG